MNVHQLRTVCQCAKLSKYMSSRPEIKFHRWATSRGQIRRQAGIIESRCKHTMIKCSTNHQMIPDNSYTTMEEMYDIFMRLLLLFFFYFSWILSLLIMFSL